jgi:hypothetical protein
MRWLQFAGEGIKREPLRGYNCSSIAITEFRAFAEIFYVLMCGTGGGFSVQKHHVKKIPAIASGEFNKIFVVADNKEGWADSIIALMENPYVSFDYSKIRPEGSPLSTGGSASGPNALIICHNTIRLILLAAMGGKLTTIECHDIVCIIADAVVVGGVRRAALISLFDADDKLMLAAKQGEWWVTHPYRARANNSAVLLRTDKNFEKKTKKVIKACYDSNAGEPGFFMTNDKEMLTNPCMPASTPVLTPYGIRALGEVGKGSKIWDGTKWVKIKRKWSTGNKDVYKYITKHGSFLGTENHVILNGGQRMEVGTAGGIDICLGQKIHPAQYGETEFKRGSNFDRSSESVPAAYLYGNPLEQISFLAGLFDCIVSPFLELTHRQTAEQLQLMLSAIGSLATIEECDGKYHLSISTEIDTAIESVQYVSNEEVFDITVDSEEHVFWSGGHLVSNCSEISLLSRGVCNLTEVNWGVVQHLPWEDKNRAFLAATILGTIQASYTDFHYISPEWKKNAEDEALLGVSITGQAENRRSLDAYLSTGICERMVEKNRQVAKMIGINQSKRITTTKPSGSASAFLGTTSGIHSAHSDFYIRRVRIDKNNPITKYLLTLPEFADFIEDDIFIKSNSIISIPICKKGTATRTDETCLNLFREMLNIQEKWITPGHVDGPNHHNVSLTLSYKPEEKDALAQMILDHSSEFNGVSLLPYDGSVYQQTPFEEITEEKYNELIAKFPDVDLSKVSFKLYADDTGTENACSSAGGSCEFGV